MSFIERAAVRFIHIQWPRRHEAPHNRSILRYWLMKLRQERVIL